MRWDLIFTIIITVAGVALALCVVAGIAVGVKTLAEILIERIDDRKTYRDSFIGGA